MKKAAGIGMGMAAVALLAVTAFAVKGRALTLTYVILLLSIIFFLATGFKGPGKAGTAKYQISLQPDTTAAAMVNSGSMDISGDFVRKSPKSAEPPQGKLSLTLPMKDSDPTGDPLKVGGKLNADDIAGLGLHDELSAALNDVLGGFGDHAAMKSAKPGFDPQGTLAVTSATSVGTASADKKTATKFKSKVKVKLAGDVTDGPNKGMTFKATLTVTTKGRVGL